MPINSFLYPGAKVTTGYDVANSVRLNRGDSPYFQRTPSSASNRRTWTWSGWIKRSNLGTIQTLFNGSDGSYPEIFYFNSDDTFIYHHDISGSDYKLISSQVFRDVSAWYHIVVAKDTTQSTETNRLKVYVNGSQITMNESALGYPPQDYQGAININDVHIVGNWKTNSYYIDGYLTEVAFIDGTQLDATSFGEFDSDSPTIWKPIDISGLTFGTNGFYLDFEDSSALGNDVSGNNNDYTPNNLSATDQSTDTCTNNFATLNPLLDVNATPTFTEGNLVFQGTGSTNFVGATIPVSSGKWYVEVKATTVNGSYPIIGVIDSQSYKRRDSTYFVGSDVNTSNPSGFAVFSNGDIYHNGDNNFSDLTTTYTSGDIIGMALDMDASPNTLGFYKNGSLEVTINLDTAPSGSYMFASSIHSSTSSAKGEFNFGNPTFSISSGNSDANGYGNFEYSVPSGYYSLCTKNLAEFG